MKALLLICALIFSAMAFADPPETKHQEPPAPAAAAASDAAKPDVILIPRDQLAALLQIVQAMTIIHNELLTPSVSRIYQAVLACVADNPSANGGVLRQGPDACPEVTQALASRAVAPSEKPEKKKKR